MRRLLLVFSLLWAVMASAQGADHALLVGVADYPALPRRLWLRGPVNDVALMREALLARGLADTAIETLVSRSPREPTRAHIVMAMQALHGKVQRGDRVLFYLAGHGSQQPQPARRVASRPREADGYDEVFLPADAAGWDGQGREAAIANALLDDEIGEWMDALVDRGATVFAIFDACHAGGLARGGGPQRWRGIDPAELGLPAPVRAKVPAGAGRTDGRVLAFAARSQELAGEEWLPRGAALGHNQIHGVFSFHLARALRSGGAGLSGQDLARAIGEAYRAEKRVSPTPQFIGMMDRSWP